MMNKFKAHSFTIPVMGIGFTLESAIKVAPLGISTVMSLVDDILIEKLREFHSRQFELPFNPISIKVEDFRAKRITAYLNMVDNIVKDKFDNMIASITEKGKEFEKYMDLLPDYSTLKLEFNEMVKNNSSLNHIKEWAQNNLPTGSIDVNIMTKLDKVNYKAGEQMPIEYNDAFAGVRGFANSDVESAIVLSAGMSPRLYSYIEQFEDFYPDENNFVKKKIILKVSDIRSALIQGQFFAKKGIWVSEYRIESGLNCGGHAFATDGLLMGPILEEFRMNHDRIVDTAHKMLCSALEAKGRHIPETSLPVKVTAQGGVGTSAEQDFLLNYYNVDSVGWGSPFLLVPEASTLDDTTMDILAKAEEKDLYLSNISPLGVKFNSVRGNTKDVEKQAKIDAGNPGSNCPKRYLVSTTEYTERALCTASKVFQKKKIAELDEQSLSPEAHKKAFDKITDKSCICVGLGTAALIVNKLDTKIEGPGVSVCPGPNIAYFNKQVSLKDMVGHIYGKNKVMDDQLRPNMFVKELKMYVDHFREKMEDMSWPLNRPSAKFVKTYEQNMILGIAYYKKLYESVHGKYDSFKAEFVDQVNQLESEFIKIQLSNQEKALDVAAV